MIETHPTESHAKTARNSKPDGKNWIIKPVPRSRHEVQLINLGPYDAKEKTKR